MKLPSRSKAYMIPEYSLTRDLLSFLNCNLQYRPTNRITLYARGENLLGQEYEINAGYPMPGATFFAGVKLTL